MRNLGVKFLKRGLFAILGLGLMSSLATAQAFDSAYTDVDLAEDCSIITADDFGALFACPGYKGYPVSVAEGDLRMFVSYGLRSQEMKASHQTFSPFNNISKKIEWRLAHYPKGWTPVATILRFLTEIENGDGTYYKGQVLVVTSISADAVCHIAYIDARANANANQMARDIADEHGGKFDCSKEPMIIGKRGKSF